MFGTLQSEARYRAIGLVADKFKVPRRAPRRVGECFHSLDSVRHFRLRFMLARPRSAKSEAVRAAKLRVNSFPGLRLPPRFTIQESRITSLHVFYPACTTWDIFANTSENLNGWRPTGASSLISRVFARSIKSA